MNFCKFSCLFCVQHALFNLGFRRERKMTFLLSVDEILCFNFSLGALNDLQILLLKRFSDKVDGAVFVDVYCFVVFWKRVRFGIGFIVSSNQWTIFIFVIILNPVFKLYFLTIKFTWLRTLPYPFTSILIKLRFIWCSLISMIC